MINIIWFSLILAGIITAASKGQINLITEGIIQGSEQAVIVALGLVGIISFWSGMMKIAQDAGLIKFLSRLMGPLIQKLFPQVPAEHPAMGAILLSMSANLLGLGNACTPLGLKAMEHLQDLNQQANLASDAMCTFMIITASSLTVIPSTIIALRSTYGSANPTEIIGPIVVATSISTLTAIIIDRVLRRFG